MRAIIAVASLFAAAASDRIPVEESSSLMQLKIPQPIKPGKHTVLLGMDVDTIEGRAALLEKVKLLVKDFQSIDQTPEDSPLRSMATATIETARGVLERVLNMEDGSIMTDHRSSLAEMQTEVDAVNACADAQQAGVDSLDVDVGTKRTHHASCRTAEKSLAGEKCELCTEWHEYVTGLTVPHCDLSDSYETLHTQLTSLQAFANTNIVQANATWKACHSATRAYEAKTQECQVSQTAFEQDYCGYRTECSSLQACYQRTQANYDAIWDTILTAIDSRKVQWQVIKQIDCFLDLIVQAADLEEGSPAPVDDEALAQCGILAGTDHLNIERAPTTPPSACNPITIGGATCEGAFFAREYHVFETTECLDQENAQGGGYHAALEAHCTSCPGASLD